MTRCPLRPFKENPKAYSEFFQLYSFKEKNALSEPGGFYDQPNAYLEIMSIMDSAVSDSYDIDKTKDSKIAVSDQEQQKTEKLASLGIPITKK